ncbi:protein kinase [Ordospora pajunii]|uniref:protein kinase n=1 Tax=Ordospora pajunii TaxID=3039483 RepID=UPI00295281B4|nr:protein kinase [Ordospora pajunii]KAH9410682.1 protein kinase [Ordospora pajunii]
MHKESSKSCVMERFCFVRKLDRGTHGTAYLLSSTDGTNQMLVCKSVSAACKGYAEQEIKMLAMLSHIRITRLIESFSTHSGVSIILEYLNHGTLAETISYLLSRRHKATSYLLWSVMSQIADALLYLHHMQVAHRDIKPSNIFVNMIPIGSQRVLEFKLGDFGLAKMCEHISSGEVVGTPYYMAPEVISGEVYSNSVDVWGLGVSLYELSVLGKPFHGNSKDELYKSILRAKLQPSSICCDKNLETLIRKCLMKTNRISIQTLCRNKNLRLHLQKLDSELHTSHECV